MRIKLNGKETEISDNLTIQELLEKMRVEPKMIACELNEKIIKRKEYGTTRIAGNDRVEILQMIGGG